MKKNLFFAAIALVALAGCTSDDFVGDKSLQEANNSGGAINFDSGFKAVTRATQDHATSAATLNNQFVVWGEKSASAEAGTAGSPVFINYVVKYKASTAGTTESNSSDWEYVGQTPYATTKVGADGTTPAITGQTIKYWDLTNKYYTFTAFSAKPGDISGDLVTVTKSVAGTTKYDKGYTMAVKEGANIDSIYFSDRTPVEAGSTTIGNAVQLNFRNLVSKVRFGFYETIPGYSVKITDVKFNSTSHTTNAAGNFGVDGSVVVPGTTTQFTVTYDDGSEISTNENKAKVTVTSPNTQGYLSTTAASFFGTELGVTSNTRTWENGGNYTTILPNPSNSTDLTLTISYTLTSTDNSGETIAITDATAKVPAAFAQWQANYAYTYLFKISDNTNGSSGQGIVGLYPITFNAVVVEDEAGNQETITTVATPSITTYAKASAVTSDNEYKKNNNIYVVVDNAGTIETLSTSNAKLYLVTNSSGTGTEQLITEESVANALVHGTPSDANNDSTNDTWTVTGVGMKPLVVSNASVPSPTASTSIPAADSPTGVEITVNGAYFKPTAAGTYAFEFTKGSDKYYKIIKVVD